MVREMLQQGEAGIVGPMQIVEQPHDRFTTGQAFDKSAEAVEEETLLLLGWELDGLRDVFVSAAQRRRQLCDLGCIGPELFTKPFGRYDAHRELETLHPRQVVLTAFQLVAVTLEHEEPMLARLGQDLLCQPRLADTRLSPDEHQISFSRTSSFHESSKLGELTLSSHERAARRGPGLEELGSLHESLKLGASFFVRRASRRVFRQQAIYQRLDRRR